MRRYKEKAQDHSYCCGARHGELCLTLGWSSPDRTPKFNKAKEETKQHGYKTQVYWPYHNAMDDQCKTKQACVLLKPGVGPHPQWKSWACNAYFMPQGEQK